MASKLHSELLKKVINAPNNLFFDVTPLGKLLNNFTGDMKRAGPEFYDAVSNLFEVLADFTIKCSFALYYQPLMLFPILLNIYWLYNINIHVKNGRKEVNRIWKLKTQDVDLHFTETTAGQSHVRAFNKAP